MSRPALVALTVGLLALLAGCSGSGGVGGIVGGPVAAATPLGDVTTTTTTIPTITGATTTLAPVPAPVPPGPGGGQPSPSATTAPPPGGAGPANPAGDLRLGGDDLGVTRVGAPIREAVAAVTAVLGPPTGDPATDTACVGSEEETSWGSFRLASSGGRVSGWLSTSTSLATPAGATVGTPLSTLEQRYGASLWVRPPAPDAGTVFTVEGANLGGTLSGSAPADTVTSFFNGTCETA